MELLIFLLKVSACTAFFFAFYLLVLQRLTFFKINRFYLLTTLVLSFIIPILHFTVEREVSVGAVQTESVSPITENELPVANVPVEPVKIEAQPFDYSTLIVPFYLAIVALLLGIATWRVLQLTKHIKKDNFRIGRIKLVPKTAGFTNCSFFNYVFIDKHNLTDHELQILLAHERVHIMQYHSIDKILMLLAKALLWLNPIVYLYDKALEETHEFEADEVTSKNFGSTDYANLLLRLAVVKTNMPLVHNFVKSPIKERIKMLFNQKSKNMKKLSYLLALPIGCLLVWLFGIQMVNAQVASDGKVKVSDSVKVPGFVNFDSAIKNIQPKKNGNTQIGLAQNDNAIRLVDNYILGKNPTVIIDGKEYDPSILTKIKPASFTNEAFTEGKVVLKTRKGKIEYASSEDIKLYKLMAKGELENLNKRVIMLKNTQIDVSDEYGCKITKIECDADNTIITFEYKANNDKDFVTINKEIYIQANNSMKHFQYLKAENIPIWPTKQYLEKAGEKIEFKIYFEKVPVTSKSIDIIERAGKSNYFNFYDVNLPASYYSAK